jgi:hypothetical protein
VLKKVELPKKNVKELQPDPLINELQKIEARLRQWLGESKENAALFRKDPITALRTSGVDLEDETMMELEMIASSIAKKLR